MKKVIVLEKTCEDLAYRLTKKSEVFFCDRYVGVNIAMVLTMVLT